MNFKDWLVGAMRTHLSIVAILAMSSSGLFGANMDLKNHYFRDFLDFAQNKGQFQVGATGLKIERKDGTFLELPNVPFPDFSSKSIYGTSTSIGGAYSVTATHNLGNQPNHFTLINPKWDQTTYSFVDKRSNNDFEAQRLNKFVVETAGIQGVDLSKLSEAEKERYKITKPDGSKAMIFYRAGDGSLQLKNSQSGQNIKYEGYHPELMSGVIGELAGRGWGANGRFEVKQNFDTFGNYVTGGDSGSSFFIYDTVDKKWVLAGTLYGNIYNQYFDNAWVNFYKQEQVDALKNTYTQNVSLAGKNYNYTQNNGNASLKSSDSTIGVDKVANVNINNSVAKNGNHFKDLNLSGGGNITLLNNMDLGIGGLIFDKNQYYSFNGKDFYYKGAGLDIGAGSLVDWNIKGLASDDLHKIGAGRLNVLISQTNKLRLGEGSVILSAQNAFEKIYITSGRGKIILNSANALKGGDGFNSVYFSNRGGILELNGYDFSANRIAASDNGAIIQNTSSKKSSVNISPNNTDYMYHGNLYGNLDVNLNKSPSSTAQKSSDNKAIIFDGNILSDGNINVSNNKLVFQGHATTHAVFVDTKLEGIEAILKGDIAVSVDRLEGSVKDEHKTNNQPSSFEQKDWEKRNFVFNEMNLANSDFVLGRDSVMIGDINATSSNLYFGGSDGKIYRDNEDGMNINNNGFGFKQHVILDSNNQARNDESIFYSGHINASDKSVIKSSANLSGVSFNLNDSSFTQENGQIYLNTRGINLANNAIFNAKNLNLYGQNISGDSSSKLVLERLGISGGQYIGANTEIKNALDFSNFGYANFAKTLKLESGAKVSANFDFNNLNERNLAFGKNYTLLNANKLEDNRSDKKLYVTGDNVESAPKTRTKRSLESNAQTSVLNGFSVISQTSNNAIIYSIQKNGEVSQNHILNAQSALKTANQSGILNQIISHNNNASQDFRYKEVALHSALMSGANANVGAIVSKVDDDFTTIAQNAAISPTKAMSANNQAVQTRVNSLKVEMRPKMANASRQSARVAGLRANALNDIRAYRDGLQKRSITGTRLHLTSSSNVPKYKNNDFSSFWGSVGGGYQWLQDAGLGIYQMNLGIDKSFGSGDSGGIFGAMVGLGGFNYVGQSYRENAMIYSGGLYFGAQASGFEYLGILNGAYTDSTTHMESKINDKSYGANFANYFKYRILSVGDSVKFGLKPFILADFNYVILPRSESEFYVRNKFENLTIGAGAGLEMEIVAQYVAHTLQFLAKSDVYNSNNNMGLKLKFATNDFLPYMISKNAINFELNWIGKQDFDNNLNLEYGIGGLINLKKEYGVKGNLRLIYIF